MKLLRGREGMTSPKAAEPANAPTPDGPCPSRCSPGRLLPPRAPVPLAPAPLWTRRALPVSLLFSPPRFLPSLGARGLSAAGRTVCVLSSGCERPCAPELGAAVSPGSRATVPSVPQRGGSAGLCRLRSRPADEPQPASLGQAACPRAGAWGGAQGERAEALHLETRFQTGRPSSGGGSGLLELLRSLFQKDRPASPRFSSYSKGRGPDEQLLTDAEAAVEEGVGLGDALQLLQSPCGPVRWFSGGSQEGLGGFPESCPPLPQPLPWARSRLCL